MSLIGPISDAIARMEGYYDSAGNRIERNVAARNNNPGNLRSWGDRPIVGGFAYFDTPEEGWAALRRQVELNINRNLTLYEFFGGGKGYPGYAPAADDNRPNQYALFVAGETGLPADVPLLELVDGYENGGEEESPLLSDADPTLLIAITAIAFFAVLL